MVLKADESSEEEDDVSLMARRFEKYLSTNSKGELSKRKNGFGPTKKTGPSTGYFKCGEMGHRIKECPIWKTTKGNSRVQGEKKVFKKAMLAAVWGDFESENDEDEKEANLCLTSLTDGDQPEDWSDTIQCLMAGGSST